MFYAYVLESVNQDYYHKGHCHDLQQRSIQHNNGMTISIRPSMPFETVYFEAFKTELEAIKRERYFKTVSGRRFLKAKIKR